MGKKDTIWIGCWDCGKSIEVAWIGDYSSRQICAECKAERAEKWQAMVSKSQVAQLRVGTSRD